MVQTSVDICNNVNLDPEMCLKRGEGVHRGFGKKMGVLVLLIFILPFKDIYIVQTMYTVEHNNKMYDKCLQLH